jgi:hypothetical protein
MIARLILVLALMFALPSATHAENGKREIQEDSTGQWGINIWGLSYHVDRSIDYEGNNWGVGVRYYVRPQWRWLGAKRDSRVFLEADALRNSHKGLVLPFSAGAEYDIMTISSGCKLFALATFSLATYQIPRTGVTEIRFGPVPGVAISCGHIKVNTIAVLQPSWQPLAVIVGSITIAVW